jgi:hypothetical protein
MYSLSLSPSLYVCRFSVLSLSLFRLLRYIHLSLSIHIYVHVFLYMCICMYKYVMYTKFLLQLPVVICISDILLGITIGAPVDASRAERHPRAYSDNDMAMELAIVFVPKAPTRDFTMSITDQSMPSQYVLLMLLH